MAQTICDAYRYFSQLLLDTHVEEVVDKTFLSALHTGLSMRSMAKGRQTYIPVLRGRELN